jgi:DNA polymerase I-like protein with 3'-5' exonuclease and polymerase domains
MPAYAQTDLEPAQSVTVHFANDQDRDVFSRLIGQSISVRTKSLWFPEQSWFGMNTEYRWVTPTPVNPRYPVYVPTKGRFETPYTIKALNRIQVKHYVVVQPQEAESYKRYALGPYSELLVLPAGLNGLVPTRNWIRQHSMEVLKADRHWQIDDNIVAFGRFHNNQRFYVNSGVIFRAIEDWTDRYENVAVSGPNYEMFVPSRSGHQFPPITMNTRVYSCSLVNNNQPHWWRDVYNDDTDLCLRAMKDGWCVALFNAFFCKKITTMRLKGGNTDIYLGAQNVRNAWLAHVSICKVCTNPEETARCDEGRKILSEDGRWKMADSLARQHPDVTIISWRWDRWQHYVDYRPFRKLPLRLRPDAVIPDRINDYGMQLVRITDDLAPAEPAPPQPAPEATGQEVAKPSSPEPEPVLARPEPSILPSPAPGPGASSLLQAEVRPLPSVLEFLSRQDTGPPPVERDFKPDEFPRLSDETDIIVNIESTGLRWWENDEPLSVTVGTIDGKRQWFLPWGFTGGNLPREQVIKFMQTEFRAKRITNGNTKFDVNMLCKVGVDLEAMDCTVSDVQHYAALLDDNRKKFNLDLLAEEFLGGARVPRVDESRMATYHAADVVARARYQVKLVAELVEVFWPKLDAEDLQKVRQLEDNVIFPVCEMERNGAPLDMERLERWVKESQTIYESLLLELTKLVGQSINPNAPTDMVKVFEKLSLPITHLASGAPSFTDAILKRIEHPIIQKIRFALKLSDLRSRYLLKYQKAVGSDGILRYALHQTRYQKDSGEEGGTGPGRFSSSELDNGVGANIQQVMKVAKQRKMFGYGEKDSTHDDEIFIIRRLMIPDRKACPHAKWLAGDAEQIEYRLFGHYANNQRVIQAYQDNPRLNFHALIEEQMSKHAAMSYDSAKTLNFAIIYGAAQVKQATMLGFITEQEAEEIREQRAWNDPRLAPMKAVASIYNRELPEVRPLLDRAQKLAASRGYVATLLGRRSRFTIDKRYHKALNNVIQGGAADYNKVKLVELHAARHYTGLLLRFTVHDEVNGDARQPETLERVREVLDAQSWPELKIQLLWDVNLGDNWAEAK